MTVEYTQSNVNWVHQEEYLNNLVTQQTQMNEIMSKKEGIACQCQEICHLFDNRSVRYFVCF